MDLRREVHFSLRRRVRTAPAKEPAPGVVATLDDPRVGAVSAALSRIRAQHEALATLEPYDPALSEPGYGHPDEIADAPIEASVDAPVEAPVASPVGPPLEWLDRASFDVPVETNFDTPVDALVAVTGATDALIDEAPAYDEFGSAPDAVLDAKLAAFFDDEPENPATLMPSWETELDGTILPRVPVRRSVTVSDRIASLTRPKKRRRRKTSKERPAARLDLRALRTRLNRRKS